MPEIKLKGDTGKALTISPGGEGIKWTQPLPPAELTAEPYIDKKAVAARLGRTTRAVNRLMRQKKIPFYKFDHRPAFRWSEVQAHLAQRFHTPPSVG